MIGIIIGVGAVIITFLLKGVSPAILINLPSIFIVIVGSIGAVIASFGLPAFKTIPKTFILATKPYSGNLVDTRIMLVDFARRARQSGMLALEGDVERLEDPFLKRGLQMVIDGIEPEHVEEVLNLEIEALQRRHSVGHQQWGLWAGYAPTFGILGAVMGLIAVMAHLSEPEKLGAGIQVAFIATLLAVGLANILFMPMSVALKGRTAAEVNERTMALTGILAIQAGDNYRVVESKLDTYLSTADRASIAARAAGKTDGAPVGAAAEAA
ncbi:MAG: motility protein A [Chloroflexota bacterium]